MAKVLLKDKNVNLSSLFLELQDEMKNKLSSYRKNIRHPVDLGNATEWRWDEMLSKYLPKRYEVKKASVLDSKGQSSDQIDVVIFDRQYSPFLFNHDGITYIPAESVYAVIEVKQEVSKRYIEYAGNKIKSVRSLYRTSAPIPHAGGVYPPRPLPYILGGIVATNSSWSPPLGTSFESSVFELSELERIDIGCSLADGTFLATYTNKDPVIEYVSKKNNLITFFLKLIELLQRSATVPAIEIDKYLASIANLTNS